ncbi:MAG: tRNA pseudouridine(55) synthase TruB [Pseudomonadota bacterium]
MTRRRRGRGRQVDGIVLLNKPAGLSSNGALRRVQRLLDANKAGHTGSLDPAATGMLPLCFGEATKTSAWLLDADKTYRVMARLGVATDTGDAEGNALKEMAVPHLSASDWEAQLAAFVGPGEQVPPMYSALKKDGQRLYELARKGQTVARAARPITISSIELLECAGRRLVFRVRCSKGTYIRVLVEDIARRAGTVAYTRRLHRESVAGFEGCGMTSLGGLERAVAALGSERPDWLLPVDRALEHLPRVSLGSGCGRLFCEGQAVASGEPGAAESSQGEAVRVYASDGRFLGVGERSGLAGIAPKRVFSQASSVPGGMADGRRQSTCAKP